MIFFQWIITLISFIILISLSIKVKKYLFETKNGLKPNFLKYLTFSFLPIALFIILSFIALFSKPNWAIQLANLLIKNIDNIPNSEQIISFIKYTATIIKFFTSFCFSLIYPAFIWLYIFPSWQPKKAFLTALYIFVFYVSWAFSLNLLANSLTAGLTPHTELTNIKSIINISIDNFMFIKNNFGNSSNWFLLWFLLIIVITLTYLNFKRHIYLCLKKKCKFYKSE